MKMAQTECLETSAYKIQTPGNYPEERIQLKCVGKLLTAELDPAFQALLFESRGCVLTFLQQFPVISHGQVLISGAYLHV